MCDVHIWAIFTQVLRLILVACEICALDYMNCMDWEFDSLCNCPLIWLGYLKQGGEQ